jgi:pimeloyl-ACP methyl ester carboxylesterase
LESEVISRIVAAERGRVRTFDAFEIRAGAATLTGVHGGAGPALVFLHAGVADSRMWQAQLEELASAHHVIAPDRRGFGRTRRVEETFSHVADLARVLDALGVSSATLIGCSQGGRVAIDFALEHPARVDALVLVGTALSGAESPPLPPPIAGLAARIGHAEAAGDLDAVNALEAHLWLDGPLEPEGRVGGAARALFLEMNAIALRAAPLGREEQPPPALPRLPALRIPTLVLCGDRDLPHIQDRSALIARTVPNARLQLLRGAAHLPNLEQPQEFTETLRAFATASGLAGIADR